jgi:hypothetical protein
VDDARDDTGQAAAREELRQVDEELAELRQTAASLRAQIGDRSDGPTDAEETALVITSAEEQEALIGALAERRERLRRRLAG